MPASTRITRTVLAERVLRLLEKEGLSKESTYDIREVRREIDNVANKILRSEWYMGKNDGDTAMRSHFLAEFSGVTLSLDAATAQNYVDIPVPYLSLPMGMGVFRVAPEQGADANKAMIPLNPYELDLHGSLPSGTFEQQWSYELRRGRLYFGTKNSQTLLQTGVTTIRLTIVIIDPIDIGDDDEYPLMPEQTHDLVKEVVQFFAPSARLWMEDPVEKDRL